ncbi:translation initiation factor IF-2-like [Mustela erminea]|uniref:translation initiation factor IF-2-like n=1 Tax=Mustela erminea TaxID=36723 RepID=UPI00138731E4|nr:translation initiation factor IF-2-like [Mustela erminea]
MGSGCDLDCLTASDPQMPGARQAQDVHVTDLKAVSEVKWTHGGLGAGSKIRDTRWRRCLTRWWVHRAASPAATPAGLHRSPKFLQSPAPALAPPPNSRALQTGKPASGAPGTRGNDRPRHRHGNADRAAGPGGLAVAERSAGFGKPRHCPDLAAEAAEGTEKPAPRPPRPPAGTRTAGAGDARCPPAASEAPGSGACARRVLAPHRPDFGKVPRDAARPQPPRDGRGAPPGLGVTVGPHASAGEPARERKEAAPPTPTRGGGSARREHGAPRGFRGNGLGACAAHSRGAPGPDLAGPAPPLPGAGPSRERKRSGRKRSERKRKCAAGSGWAEGGAGASLAPRRPRRAPGRSPPIDPRASPSPAPHVPAARPCGSAPCFLLFGARPTLLSPRGRAPAPGRALRCRPRGRPPTRAPAAQSCGALAAAVGPLQGRRRAGGRAEARGVSVRDAFAQEDLALEAGPEAAPPRGDRGDRVRGRPGRWGRDARLRQGLAGSPGEFGARGPRRVGPARRLWGSVLRREESRRRPQGRRPGAENPRTAVQSGLAGKAGAFGPGHGAQILARAVCGRFLPARRLPSRSSAAAVPRPAAPGARNAPSAPPPASCVCGKHRRDLGCAPARPLTFASALLDHLTAAFLAVIPGRAAVQTCGDPGSLLASGFSSVRRTRRPAVTSRAPVLFRIRRFCPVPEPDSGCR